MNHPTRQLLSPGELRLAVSEIRGGYYHGKRLGELWIMDDSRIELDGEAVDLWGRELDDLMFCGRARWN